MFEGTNLLLSKFIYYNSIVLQYLSYLVFFKGFAEWIPVILSMIACLVVSSHLPPRSGCNMFQELGCSRYVSYV